MSESECGCKFGHYCPEAVRMFERVKSLYEDARVAGFQHRFFERYQKAMELYRTHRDKALGRSPVL